MVKTIIELCPIMVKTIIELCPIMVKTIISYEKIRYSLLRKTKKGVKILHSKVVRSTTLFYEVKLRKRILKCFAQPSKGYGNRGRSFCPTKTMFLLDFNCKQKLRLYPWQGKGYEFVFAYLKRKSIEDLYARSFIFLLKRS